jgi:hypothetical protein
MIQFGFWFERLFQNMEWPFQLTKLQPHYNLAHFLVIQKHMKAASKGYFSLSRLSFNSFRLSTS